jgi:two-component system LytT family response regulator
MKILIIEDEQSNADRLCRMLEKEHEIAGVAASNAEIRKFFSDSAHTDVDLILSDIQLGDGLSFEGLLAVPQSIPVIFTTAYDQYAIRAFKFNSIDYLLKPIESTELQAALTKVQELSSVNAQLSMSTTDAITQLLKSVKSQTIRYRERFLISYRDTYTIIPVREVSHIGIKNGMVHLYTINEKNHALNLTLDELESQLDPLRFMRVNRQFIVSASAVEKLSTFFLGKIRIHLYGYPNTDIIVSRDKVSAVKRWLDS